MLFASTRLTLVKELGGERFQETLFVTELKELERQGWEKHERSKKLAAPLTEEEELLRGVKDAEAQTQAGTAGKRMHFGSGPSLGIEGSARTSLEGLRDAGSNYNLVQLVRFGKWMRRESRRRWLEVENKPGRRDCACGNELHQRGRLGSLHLSYRASIFVL